MTDTMFPKPPKRMKQPKKDILREQITLAAGALIDAREDAERARAWIESDPEAEGSITVGLWVVCVSLVAVFAAGFFVGLCL